MSTLEKAGKFKNPKLTQDLEVDGGRGCFVTDAIVGLADVNAGFMPVNRLDHEGLGLSCFLSAGQEVVLQHRKQLNLRLSFPS